MSQIDPVFTSFADAYSDAVLAYVRSGRSQAVYFRRRKGRFEAENLEDGMSPADVDLHIGHDWHRAFPDLGCAIASDDPDYSPGAIKSSVVRHILQSDFHLGLCHRMQGIAGLEPA